MTAPALEVQHLNRNFGALQVARDINLTLERGARRALIGPNGAGKTTLVNLINGALAPSSGRVLLYGEDITRLSQAGRARRGIARTSRSISCSAGFPCWRTSASRSVSAAASATIYGGRPVPGAP